MRVTSSSVGARIRDAREALGISRGELASRVRRSEDAVALYETGVLVPSTCVLALLAQALGVALDDLADDLVKEVDAGIARNLGDGPLVPPGRRAAMITLLSPPAGHRA